MNIACRKCRNFKWPWKSGVFLMPIIFFLLAPSSEVFAQDNKSKEIVPVHVVARAYEDSIVLRLVPGSSALWELAMQKGYQIRRIEMLLNEQVQSTMLTKAPFLPMGQRELQEKYGRSDKYVGVVENAMYGEKFKMKEEAPVNLVDSLQQAKEAQDFRFFLAMQAAGFSANAGVVAGVRWVDKDVKPGARYVYIVTTTAANENIKADSGVVAILNARMKPEVPTGLSALSYDKKIELHWDRKQLGRFDTYDVERSDDGGKTFKTLNNAPYYTPFDAGMASKRDTFSIEMVNILESNQVFIDSVPQNYKDYFYRIRGYNGFAEVSPYTKAIKVHAIDLTPPEVTVINAFTNPKENAFEISWTPNTVDPDLDGYYLFRSTMIKGPYVPVTPNMLDKTTSRYLDTLPTPGMTNYYILSSVDTAKNVSVSPAIMAVFTDSIPPMAPTALKGFIDSTGITHLSWERNKEPDIKGYKVYFSYNKNSEFSQVTSIPVNDSTFTDTISMKSLDRRVYYKIAAVDYNNNHSPYSEVGTFNKPILFPPTVVAAKNIYVSDGKVHSEWYGSSSEGVSGYEVFRKTGDSAWRSLKVLHMPRGRDFEYLDSAITPNVEYFYAAETIDSTGIRSEKSSAVSITYTNSETLHAVTELVAGYDAKEQGVKLSWKYQYEGDYFYVIFRATDGNPLTAWRTIDKTHNNLVDYQVKKGGKYQYAIKIKEKAKHLGSGLSEPAVVSIPSN